MKNLNTETIDSIISGLLRGENNSTISRDLGIHRLTVAEIRKSEKFEQRVTFLLSLLDVCTHLQKALQNDGDVESVLDVDS